MTIDPRLHRIVASQPYPLLFATISGAHLIHTTPEHEELKALCSSKLRMR
jgi:hypothetical protein